MHLNYSLETDLNTNYNVIGFTLQSGSKKKKTFNNNEVKDQT